MQRSKFYSLTYGVGITAVFLLLSTIKIFGDFSPFLLGFFIALTYSKQNFLISAPVYVLASFISTPTLESLVVSATPVAILAVVYFIHYKLGRRVTLPIVLVAGFISEIPSVVFSVIGGESLLFIISAVVVTQLFSICAVIATYAILVRGIHAKYTLDEQISICAVVVVLSTALFGVEVFGVRLYYTLVSFTVSVLVYSLGNVGIVGALVCGAGGVFCGYPEVAICVLAGASCVLAFRTISPYVSAVGYLLSAVGVGFYMGIGDLAYVVTNAVGVAVFCLLPRGAKNQLGGLLSAFTSNHGGRHLVNRNRIELSNRLCAVAKVFWELSAVVSDTGGEEKREERAEVVCNRLVSQLCGDCPKRRKCEKILSGEIGQLFYPLVHTAILRGKATLLELPPYVTGSCIRVGELIPVVNQMVEEERKRAKEKRAEGGAKLFFAEQLISVGELLSGLSREVRRTVGFDTAKERQLVDELAYLNILCSEAIIEEGGSVVLTVKEGDARRRGLEKVVGKIVGKKVRAKVERAVGIDGFDTVTLSPSPRFDMAFGEAVSAKEGEKRCGDSRLVLHPSVDNYVMILADGMGSGEDAERASSSAVGLVESFFRAGFENKTVINLVNKMLVSTGSEGYNTLDMCICNMNGECDFIKMGSCPSFIKREEGIDVLESTALPMGVLKEAVPTIIKKSLNKNDIIVLVSDGVTDVLGVEGVVDYLRESRSTNPQLIARELHEKVVVRGRCDDVSIVVGKVF